MKRCSPSRTNRLPLRLPALALGLAAHCSVCAQTESLSPAAAVPQLPGAAQPGNTTPKAPNSDPTNNAPGALFDNRLPMLDPSGGLLRFNGQTWDIQNNAVFRGRFEKYLNTPEENGEEERAHREILNRIIFLLEPNNLKPQTLTEAYRLLSRAAGYPGDSRLCDTLSNAIYAVWGVKRNQAKLEEANQILEEENKRLRRNIAVRVSAEDFQKSPDGRTASMATPSQPAGA
ncbi:MAG: hypothetical protein EBS01_04610, partial [Verrucomicrobia bacterium]|nr:hypothetical protein [Verrucomicrobiota bacterium]